MSEKTIGFATFDWAIGTKPLEPNGCAWYRSLLPMNELKKFDWFCDIGALEYNEESGFGVFDIETGSAAFGWDIIVFKLVMLGRVADIMNGPERPSQKIVVDVDDWYEGLQEENLAHKMTDPEKNPDNNREHYMSIIDSADAIITSTPFLYDYYKNKQGKKNVFMVRNGIDVDRWNRKTDHSRYLPTVGWVGAVPWRSNDLESIAPVFGKYMSNHRLPFHHSGHIKGVRSSDERLGIQKGSTKVTYNERMIISKYPQMFKKIDIGIVPLNNIPFNHAKSGIKGLEYTASGIPYIASWSPEYEYLNSLGIGRIAMDLDDWEKHLDELQDPRIRKEEIDKSYENMMKTQSMEVRGSEWNDVMEQILAL
jgi:hypothetical protein